MKRLVVLCVAALAACHGGGKPGEISPTVRDAENLVGKQMNDKTIAFFDAQTVGVPPTQKTCGHFKRRNAFGGTDMIRFIAFTGGNGGENPFIDDVSSPYPIKKRDFGAAWGACKRDGYVAPPAPRAGTKPARAKSKF
jgi:hypothetical protein